MKILMSIAIIAIVGFISCEKDESINREYLNEITGIYIGEFTIDNGLKTGIHGTAEVTNMSNEQIQIHCYGEIMDTTFIMDVFAYGDSIMVCNSGNDFYNEYGHMGNGYHMMDMGMGGSEWTHHLDEDHQSGDLHYGGFNMEMHSFEYLFKMKETDSIYYINFIGIDS